MYINSPLLCFLRLAIPFQSPLDRPPRGSHKRGKDPSLRRKKRWAPMKWSRTHNVIYNPYIYITGINYVKYVRIFQIYPNITWHHWDIQNRFQALSNLDAHPTRSLGGTDLLNFRVPNVCGIPNMTGRGGIPQEFCGKIHLPWDWSLKDWNSTFKHWDAIILKHEAGTGACLHQNFQQAKKQGFAMKLGDLPAKTWPKMGHTDLQPRECKQKHHISARKVDFLSPWGFHQNAKHKDAGKQLAKTSRQPRNRRWFRWDWWFRESQQLKPSNRAIFHVGFCNSDTVTPSAKSHGAIYFDRDSICNASAGEYQAEKPIMQNFKSTNLTCT